MAKEKKLTKKENIKMLLELEEVKNNPIHREYLEHELELLEHRSASKTQTATQKANEGLKEKIYEGMEENRYYSATEIVKMFSEEIHSQQKATALLGQLVTEEKIERVVDKRKTYFVRRG
jgi:hypothetical protein